MPHRRRQQPPYRRRQQPPHRRPVEAAPPRRHRRVSGSEHHHHAHLYKICPMLPHVLRSDRRRAGKCRSKLLKTLIFRLKIAVHFSLDFCRRLNVSLAVSYIIGFLSSRRRFPTDQFQFLSTVELGLVVPSPPPSTVDSPSLGRPNIADHHRSIHLLSPSLGFRRRSSAVAAPIGGGLPPLSSPLHGASSSLILYSHR
ncbi:hypothetical protein Salat_1794800 [Sesamum alatum]|uniref:Uncharacterized protein n=1 Tax=Sesamum alatum TaxID=300844 RepID=A0AAE1Y1Q7_9LAMI|nr:hypothetical protein Salat_1794800 [Sesamum alatum]